MIDITDRVNGFFLQMMLSRSEIQYRKQVDFVREIKIVIHTREDIRHIPHFHIEWKGLEASIGINEFKVIVGNVPNKELKIIKVWYIKNKPLLIKVWNETRPSRN